MCPPFPRRKTGKKGIHHSSLIICTLAIGLQWQLDDLTIFEYLLYASLFTFQNLVPERFELSMIDDEWDEIHQSAWDALSELLMWKLKTRDEKDLKLNERFLAKSLKRHLIPLLLPGERSPSLSLKNLEVFSQLVAAVVKRNNFLHRTIFEFCLDDDYRYKFDGEHLTLYPIEIPEESEWDFNGRKLSALHNYWFNRAVIEYFNSDLPNEKFGLPENDVSNRMAYIKATQVYLQLDEINGKDPGEVDLLCYLDKHLLVLEVKSTYIRKTKQDAWIHRTNTLRKASQQLRQKENAIAQAIVDDANLQSKLKIPDQKDAIKIYPWIVDSSIEYDQELIDGYLKVSLEGLIVILNNERELLTGNLLTEEELPKDDMFSGGFSVRRFIELVEKGELWSVLEEGTYINIT